MEKVVFYWGIIFSLAIVCMEFVRHFDETEWEWLFSDYRTLFWSSGINGMFIFYIMKKAVLSQSSALLLCLLAGCLLFACMTDGKSCEVFSFVWWIGGSVAGIMLLLSCIEAYRANNIIGQAVEQQWIPLFLYIVLQEYFFCKFYGKADCHAFAICGIAESALGMGVQEFLLHMVISFGLLAIVQLHRGNISKTGNLIQPVAFLPYITISFWVLLFLEKNVILERISETVYLGGL
uniref:hypothetical protein n=1 Tax=Acetatifactor sp. TaxID=1872090 RepID=UPI004056ED68